MSANSVTLEDQGGAGGTGFALQAILTGESDSVEKHMDKVEDPRALYQDKTCILFSVRFPMLCIQLTLSLKSCSLRRSEVSFILIYTTLLQGLEAV